MEEMVVRRASSGDLEAVAEISRMTWEGDDYLEGEAAGWIADGTLHVGQLEGVVIGTFRISSMPCGVLWLEALRVHARHRGSGLGRRLATAAFEMGRGIIRSGGGSCMEFSTYIKNHESIHISLSQGFRVSNRFMLMTSEEFEPSGDVNPFIPGDEDFREFREHIPCGWKYPRLCSGGIRWALKRCDALEYGGVAFIRRRGSGEAAPLAGSMEAPEVFLRGVENAAACSGETSSHIVVHESRKDIIDLAFQRGYGTWDPVDGHNVLIFRFEE